MSTVDDERTGGVQGVLEALTATVAGARAMPMSSSVLVNKAEVLDLIEQAREALPSLLTQADALLADADAAKEQARAEAVGIIAAAHEEADRLVEHLNAQGETANRIGRITERTGEPVTFEGKLGL